MTRDGILAGVLCGLLILVGYACMYIFMLPRMQWL